MRNSGCNSPGLLDSDKLLQNINNEFGIVLKKFEDKEAVIRKGREFIGEIEGIVGSVKDGTRC